ncbi:MAG: hypothetical protein II567_01025, partial [Candidatus Riflebacteria bacterium]|nr:hypothetical protein [Candidatus Riflebacteria bacterium]
TFLVTDSFTTFAPVSATVVPVERIFASAYLSFAFLYKVICFIFLANTGIIVVKDVVIAIRVFKNF